jgi:hypothetical protein
LSKISNVVYREFEQAETFHFRESFPQLGAVAPRASGSRQD